MDFKFSYFNHIHTLLSVFMYSISILFYSFLMALRLMRISSLRTHSPLLHSFSSSSLPRRRRRLPPLSAVDSVPPTELQPSASPPLANQRRWKPMCLYFTQNKCTMMEDGMHMEKFNHDLGVDLSVDEMRLDNVSPQEFDYFLILDLEGKVEILEFPVIMIDARNLKFVDSFHRFVRPTVMTEQRIGEYIEGKYGKFGVDRVWHDTAIPFKEVIEEFEQWLENHQLWDKTKEGSLNRAAFITCGNWDLKTKVPDQCRVSKIKLPHYFMEWINVKDIFLNFYNKRATGMMTMMKELNMATFGSHHLGIDDSKNIARVVQQMISDGALMQITASFSDSGVKYRFKNRI